MTKVEERKKRLEEEDRQNLIADEVSSAGFSDAEKEREENLAWAEIQN